MKFEMQQKNRVFLENMTNMLDSLFYANRKSMINIIINYAIDVKIKI